MSNNNTSSSGGIGFVGLLTIVFITLKLCDVITWSWWLVLSPIWISISFVLIVLVGLFVFLYIREHLKAKKRRNNRLFHHGKRN